MKKRFFYLNGCFLLLLLIAFNCFAQTETFDSLVKANSYPLTLSNGKLSGGGMDFLMKASSDAQFFVIGEEHNVKEIPEITTMLFDALHRQYGYNYLALEQDPLACLLSSEKPLLGNLNQVYAFGKKYPQAFTFYTDEELKMITAIGNLSNAKTDRIWGLDQMFGVTHALEQLIKFAPDKDARTRTLKLIEHSRSFESERMKNGKLYISGEVEKPADFYKLNEIYQPKKNSEAEFLINQLLLSNRVYRHYLDGRDGKIPGTFENGREREENMKDLFMMNYRRAQAKGEKLPKVLLKLGHWHTIRGIFDAKVPTLGNFVSDFAKSNGMKSFQLATFINNKPGGFRAYAADFWAHPLVESTSSDSWTIVDLRPLRDYIFARKITVNPELNRMIFAFDAVLMIGGANPATHAQTGD